MRREEVKQLLRTPLTRTFLYDAPVWVALERAVRDERVPEWMKLCCYARIAQITGEQGVITRNSLRVYLALIS